MATGKIRPLTIKCNNFRDKLNIFQNARKLKDSNYSSIIIKPDLTKCQQIEQKQLYAELNTRREARENVNIKNGRIIPKSSLND